MFNSLYAHLDKISAKGEFCHFVLQKEVSVKLLIYLPQEFLNKQQK